MLIQGKYQNNIYKICKFYIKTYKFIYQNKNIFILNFNILGINKNQFIYNLEKKQSKIIIMNPFLKNYNIKK